MGICGFHIQKITAFSKTDDFFSLGNVDNLSSEKNSRKCWISWLQEWRTSSKHAGKCINDPETPILTTPYRWSILATIPESENFTVKDSLPRKWTRKDISIARKDKIEFENTQAPTDVDLAPHKFFELFFNDGVIKHLCKQSKYTETITEPLNFMLLQMRSVLFLQSCLFLSICCYHIIECIESKRLMFLIVLCQVY